MFEQMNLDDIVAEVHVDDAMDYYDEITAHICDWWENHAYFTKLNIQFKPAKEFFKAAIESKSLILIILRQKSTKNLMGAYIGVLQKFLHNQDVTMCSEVIWFLNQAYQNKQCSGLLLGTVENVLKQYQIDMMTCSIAHLDNEPEEVTQKKIASLGRIGYNKTDTIFYKRIQ